MNKTVTLVQTPKGLYAWSGLNTQSCIMSVFKEESLIYPRLEKELAKLIKDRKITQMEATKYYDSIIDIDNEKGNLVDLLNMIKLGEVLKVNILIMVGGDNKI